MRYEHSAICTTDGEVEVNRTYVYVEERLMIEVVLVEDLSDEEFIRLRLRALRANRDHNVPTAFVVDITREAPDYFIWRLFDRPPNFQFPQYG